MKDETPLETNTDGDGTSGENDENQSKTTLRFELPARQSSKFTPGGANQPSPESKSHGWWKKRKGRVLFQSIMQLPAVGSNWVHDPESGEMVDQLAKVRQQAAVYFNMPESLITVEMLAFMKQVAIAIQRNDPHSTVAFNSAMDQSYGRPKPMEDFEEVEKPQLNIYLGSGKTDDKISEEPMEDGRGDAPPIATSEGDIKI